MLRRPEPQLGNCSVILPFCVSASSASSFWLCYAAPFFPSSRSRLAELTSFLRASAREILKSRISDTPTAVPVCEVVLMFQKRVSVRKKEYEAAWIQKGNDRVAGGWAPGVRPLLATASKRKPGESVFFTESTRTDAKCVRVCRCVWESWIWKTVTEQARLIYNK